LLNLTTQLSLRRRTGVQRQLEQSTPDSAYRHRSETVQEQCEEDLLL